MARALIKINGADTQSATVAIGSVVMLSNHDEGGETTYAWTVIDQPEGTPDVLSNAAIESPTLTVTKEGTYALRLVVNQGTGTEAIQTAVVAVLDARTGERIPAASETTETGLAKGWALAVNRIMAHVLHAAVDSNLVVAQTPGSISPGTVVKLTGIATANAGSQSAFTVTQIATALGTTTHPERLGILVDGVIPGIVTASALVVVRIVGLVPFNGTGSPTVGDAVFLSDAGAPSLAPGSVSRIIGRVVASSAGSFQWVIDTGVDTGVQSSGRMLAAPIRLTGSGSGTFPAGTCVVDLDGIGGGGGGGGAKGNASIAGAGGGSSGVRLRKRIGTLGVPLANLNYSWASGTGGPGGLGATPTNGTAGNDTTVTINGTTYTMKGGGSGILANGAAFGISQSSAPAAGTSGVAGESGYDLGQDGIMLNGTAWQSGSGGGTDLGGGGASVGGTTVGNTGQGMGGGGSGGAASAAGTSNGGAGADGGAWVTPYS